MVVIAREDSFFLRNFRFILRTCLNGGSILKLTFWDIKLIAVLVIVPGVIVVAGDDLSRLSLLNLNFLCYPSYLSHPWKLFSMNSYFFYSLLWKNHHDNIKTCRYTIKHKTLSYWTYGCAVVFSMKVGLLVFILWDIKDIYFW